jgi:hypothetical protein
MNPGRINGPTFPNLDRGNKPDDTYSVKPIRELQALLRFIVAQFERPALDEAGPTFLTDFRRAAPKRTDNRYWGHDRYSGRYYYCGEPVFSHIDPALSCFYAERDA